MNNIPFRIRIGLIGHRNLKNKDLLLPLIEKALGLQYWLKNKEVAPHSLFSFYPEASVKYLKGVANTPLGLTAMSPLAEGADCLLTQAVLDTGGPNIQIEAVLPFEKEDYLATFSSNEDRTIFEELYKQDPNPHVIQSPIDYKKTKGKIKKAERGIYFGACAKYILNHCDVLIAIWDENPARGHGGTAETIAYAREIGRPRIVLSVKDPNEPKIIIEKGNGLNAYPILGIDKFNSIQTSKAKRESGLLKLENKNFGKEQKIALPKELKEDIRSHIFPFYSIADKMSVSHKPRYVNTGLAAYIFSTLAVVLVALGLAYKPLYHLVFVFEFFLLIIILGLIFWANKNKFHKKWLEFRFLTERLRAMMYVHVANLPMRQLRIDPYFKVNMKEDKQEEQEEQEWIARILREVWYNLKKNDKRNRELGTNELKYVVENWIVDQLDYHQDNYTKKSRSNNRWEWAGMLVFALAVVVAGLHWIPYYLFHAEIGKIPDSLLIIFGLGFPALAAMIEGVRRKMEYSRESKKSKAMVRSLKSILIRLQHASTDFENKQLLSEAQDLILQELQDWILMRSVLELEPVV